MWIKKKSLHETHWENVVVEQQHIGGEWMALLRICIRINIPHESNSNDEVELMLKLKSPFKAIKIGRSRLLRNFFLFG